MIQMRTTATLALVLMLAACGGTVGTDDDAGPDTSEDTTVTDSSTDTAVDTGEDAPPDLPEDTPVADTTEDTAEDVMEDIVPDPVEDTAEPDTTTDVVTDGECGTVMIPFEAEEMSLSGFSVRTSSRDYIGDFIETDRDDEGVASVTLDIPCTDTYVMWGLVWWESGSEDSYLWTWDTGSEPVQWDVMQQCSTTIPADWYWDQVSWKYDDGYCGTPEEDPATMPLTAGSHTFYLFGREAMTAVDEFILTNDPAYVPPDPG